jgi:protein-S-isoprenylcysteine O-methyltransferase Ste14
MASLAGGGSGGIGLVGKIAGAFRVVLTPQILLMVTKVYIPFLFPLTFFIAMASLWLDGVLGFGGGFLPTPMNYGVAAAFFVAGLLVVGITYQELVFEGAGSPSPTAGRTLKLVRSGIYAYCRNPSVHGKLLGFLAVGIALNSLTFCFVLAPLLLAGSLIEKVVRQEPQLVEVFGEEYLKYQREVPLFIPWGLIGIRSPFRSL